MTGDDRLRSDLIRRNLKFLILNYVPLHFLTSDFVLVEIIESGKNGLGLRADH